MKFFAVFGLFLITLSIIFGFALLLAFPTMWLVNAVLAPSAITAIFGVAKIGFWQALGLGILTGLLFRPTIQK